MSTIDEFLPAYLTVKNLLTPEVKTARVLEFELAQKAAAGDIEAFEQIYWKHHRRVFGICVRMVNDPTEAEDITQQIFLQLFRKVGSFRGDSAFSTWLHRMTVNQTLMHLRSKKSCKEQTTEDGNLPENGYAQSQKPNEVKQLFDKFQLDQAIAQLPDGYRKVVILHDIQGFEHDEIARILGCASGTSKSQLHKARRKLRRLLTTDKS